MAGARIYATVSSGEAAAYQALLDGSFSLINGDVGKCGSTRVRVRNRDAPEHPPPADMWTISLGELWIR